VAGQQLAAVLGAGGALDQRFDEVADDAQPAQREQRQQQADDAAALQQAAIDAGTIDAEAAVELRAGTVLIGTDRARDGAEWSALDALQPWEAVVIAT